MACFLCLRRKKRRNIQCFSLDFLPLTAIKKDILYSAFLFIYSYYLTKKDKLYRAVKSAQIRPWFRLVFVHQVKALFRLFRLRKTSGFE